MSMRWKERLAGIGCFILFLAGFLVSRAFPAIPKIIPTAVTVCGMALCAGLFGRSFFFQYTDDGEVLTEEKKNGMVKIALAILMLVIYVLLMPKIGFFLSSFIFIIVFSYVIDTEKHKLWMYPAVAAGLLAIIWVIFRWFLKVPLPQGILF